LQENAQFFQGDDLRLTDPKFPGASVRANTSPQSAASISFAKGIVYGKGGVIDLAVALAARPGGATTALLGEPATPANCSRSTKSSGGPLDAAAKAEMRSHPTKRR